MNDEQRKVDSSEIARNRNRASYYSAFDGTDLGLQLRRLGVNEVWIGGLATDYCVKNTVLDAVKEGFAVKALENAMRPVEVNPGDGARALEEMRAAGAGVVKDDGETRGHGEAKIQGVETG